MTLKELIETLQDNNEHPLDFKPIGDGRWFLASVINKFAIHGIIHTDKRIAEKYKMTNYDVLSKGENYDTTRVFRMDNYTRSAFDLDLMPTSPIPIL